jgi:hypothetical protein
MVGCHLFGVHIFSRYVCYDLSYSEYHSAQGKNYLSMHFIKESSYQDIFQRRYDKKKVKISLLQAVEAPRVARDRGSHIT